MAFCPVVAVVMLKSQVTNCVHSTLHSTSQSAFPTVSCIFKKCLENKNNQFTFNNFFLENRDVYEIMWKNIVERCRVQMIIWRMRNACRIIKATRTHSEYVILIAFLLQNIYTNAPLCYVIRILRVLLLVTNNTNKASINNNDRYSLFAVCFNDMLFP
jgi:hypothetical protein